jgi:hypothetical protein
MTRADAMQIALDALLTCRLEGDGWSGPNQVYDEAKVQSAIKALDTFLKSEGDNK